MMQPQTMLVVADVEASSSWFQDVLGLTSGHGGPEYEMLFDGDAFVLQLHRWEADEHPHLGDPANSSRGNGVVVWFSTDDFGAQLARVEAHGAEVLEGPLFNENAQHDEIWLRHPEGYVVVVNGPRRM